MTAPSRRGNPRNNENLKCNCSVQCGEDRGAMSSSSSEDLLRVDWTGRNATTKPARPTAGVRREKGSPTRPVSQSVQMTARNPRNKENLRYNCSVQCGEDRGAMSSSSSEDLLRVDWTGRNATTKPARPTAGVRREKGSPTRPVSQFSSVSSNDRPLS